ncbi:ATP synthase subunit b, mitochondrial [Ceratina calcarata]|uniref:ATP synthase subunit b n=1 Tax=Ceratina calcarata TaxID=156304 RepID=A0AAJ7IU01_9HYME|nr:ATP synthase subunit b, mitochondrial [Ceratina calcarata]
MLSRLSFRNVSSQVKALASCGIQTSAVACDAPRPKRPVEAPPVRLGFIPEEWFTFFYPKTGVSGPYVFMGTVSTYLLSKEWYVIEHEFYNGLSILFAAVYVSIKAGDKIANYLDKQIDDLEDSYNVSKDETITELKNNIAEIEKEKWRTDGQLMIFDIKKQNVLMQLEADYRKRLADVYSEVKRRLDYHAQIDLIERRMSQKHMVQWITSSVLKAITPEQEKANLLQCIRDLEGLSSKAAA